MIDFSQFLALRRRRAQAYKAQPLAHCALSLPPLIRWGERKGTFGTEKTPIRPRAVWGIEGFMLYVQCMCGCMCNVCAEK